MEVGVFLGDAAAGEDYVTELAGGFFAFGREEQCNGRGLKVVEFGDAIARSFQRGPHQEAVEIYGGGAEGELRQFEHDAHLHDKLHSLGSRRTLIGGRHAVLN